MPGAKSLVTIAGLDVGPILVPTTVLADATDPYMGELALAFEKAETCRVDLTIQVTPNGQDSNVSSKAEFKNLGVPGNFGSLGSDKMLRLIFYSLDLRDLNPG